MKNIFCSIILVCALLVPIYAQEKAPMTDEARIELSVYMDPTSQIPSQAKKVLKDRLLKVVAKNGLGATKNARFIVTANVHELNLEKSETAPVIYIYNLEVNLFLGDGIDGTLFSSCSVELSGAGDTKEKAYLAALKKLPATDPVFKPFLTKGKEEIVKYYDSKCDFIIKEAVAKADRKEFDEAIYKLLSVPSVCKGCYDKVQEMSVQIYKRKIENDCQVNLSKAKTEIAGNNWDEALKYLSGYTPDMECYPEVATLMKDIQDHRCADALARAQSAWASRNAGEAASWLAEVSADSKCYAEARQLQESISSKLDADEKREWDFKLKQHQDEVDLENASINAIRDIGVAFGENQQPTTYNIIGWW